MPEAFETAAGKAFITSDTGKDGTTTVKMYSVIIAGDKFTGYIIAQAREDAAKPMSDEAMRKMLASAKLRNEVPTDEQLSLMPFKIGELSNFKTVRTLAPRSSILLTDGTEDTTLDGAPYMVIGLTAAGPEKPDDRGRFAQQAAAAIPGTATRASPRMSRCASTARRDTRHGSMRSPERRHPGHRGAMAEIRRRNVAADYRKRDTRGLAEGISAFPCRARRH
jgi:hypothetical protein